MTTANQQEDGSSSSSQHQPDPTTLQHLQHTIFGIQNVELLIQEKKQELEVYCKANQELEAGEGNTCMVFLGCNLFVQRTKQQGREMLNRMITERQRLVENLEKQKNSMHKRLELITAIKMNKEGQVDICEVDNHPVELKSRRRIAHKPKELAKLLTENVDSNIQLVENIPAREKNNIPFEAMAVLSTPYKQQAMLANAEEVSSKKEVKRVEDVQVEESAKPTGVSDKDFNSFLQIMNELAAERDDDEEVPLSDISEAEEEEDQVDEVRTKLKKRVQFQEEIEQEATATTGFKIEMKPILKNKDEISPVNKEVVKEMDERGVKKIVPVSRETIKDEIVERTGDHLDDNKTHKTKEPKRMSKFRQTRAK